MDVSEAGAGELTVVISEDLCIYEIAQLHDQLLPQLAGGQKIQLDLGAVAECDSAGLQWLLALRAWARSSGVALSFEPLSDAVRELVDLCQVQSLLGLQTVIPADMGAC